MKASREVRANWLSPVNWLPSANMTPIANTTTSSEQVSYLQSLKSIRERCQALYEAIKSSPGSQDCCFEVREDRLEGVVEFVASLILRDYRDPAQDVPPHGRWRHFLPAGSVESGVIEALKAKKCGEKTITVALLDLCTGSVLLDAGAGAKWSYCSARSGIKIGRSEGLAVASLDMFMAGLFSSSQEGDELRVDAEALLKLTLEDLARGLQVDEEKNPLLGLPGRLELLHSLGRVLKNKPEYFAHDGSHRPGNLLYFLLSQSSSSNQSVPIETLWRVTIDGFGGVWPASRTKLEGVSLGDVWPSRLLGGQLVPFHKLSQWLTYSLIEPLERVAGLKIEGAERMTGLAEYRNGGLFIDFGVITLRERINEKGKPVYSKGKYLLILY